MESRPGQLDVKSAEATIEKIKQQTTKSELEEGLYPNSKLSQLNTTPTNLDKIMQAQHYEMGADEKAMVRRITNKSAEQHFPQQKQAALDGLVLFKKTQSWFAYFKGDGVERVVVYARLINDTNNLFELRVILAGIFTETETATETGKGKNVRQAIRKALGDGFKTDDAACFTLLTGILGSCPRMTYGEVERIRVNAAEQINRIVFYEKRKESHQGNMLMKTFMQQLANTKKYVDNNMKQPGFRK